jgi:hypothetical protein
VTSNRNEPYWAAVREETRRSEWLRDKLELWRSRFPNLDDSYDRSLFRDGNYTYVLYPRGYFAKLDSPLSGSILVEHWRAFGQDLKQQVTGFLAALPSHYDLLTNIRASRQLSALRIQRERVASF